MRAAELRDHRRSLAAALAAELPAALARSTGASEEQIDAAFESMARRALSRRRGE